MNERCLQVYCEMEVNEGGYTFIKPDDLEKLNNEQIQDIVTDTSSVLIRTTPVDDTQSQKFAVLEQLENYK